MRSGGFFRKTLVLVYGSVALFAALIVAIYAAISGIPMVMDNFVTLALEGIKKEFLKDIGIDVSEIGQQLCRGILFFPCIDAMVYLLCPANIPLMSFLPEKEMPSSCKEDEKQGYTNNEGGLYHLFFNKGRI